MSRKTENTGFICEHCGRMVALLTNGSYRNHCPGCLYSIHVDDMSGDRASGCFGLMHPIGVQYHSKKGYQIIHRCMICGEEKTNRTAPDDFEALIVFMSMKGQRND